jgi:hypothetical protein
MLPTQRVRHGEQVLLQTAVLAADGDRQGCRRGRSAMGLMHADQRQRQGISSPPKHPFFWFTCPLLPTSKTFLRPFLLCTYTTTN